MQKLSRNYLGLFPKNQEPFAKPKRLKLANLNGEIRQRIRMVSGEINEIKESLARKPIRVIVR